MKTTNLTIADIVSTKEFNENLVQKVNELVRYRRLADFNLKRDAIERLIEKEVLQNSERFTVIYAQVLTKSCDTTEYPRALRDCIRYIGDCALYKTINQFKAIENEKSN